MRTRHVGGQDETGTSLSGGTSGDGGMDPEPLGGPGTDVPGAPGTAVPGAIGYHRGTSRPLARTPAVGGRAGAGRCLQQVEQVTGVEAQGVSERTDRFRARRSCGRAERLTDDGTSQAAASRHLLHGQVLLEARALEPGA